MGAVLKIDMDRLGRGPLRLEAEVDSFPVAATCSAPTVLRLLLIESDLLAAKRVTRSLEELGSSRVHIEHVGTVDDALTSKANERFDIILVDLSAQDADGIEGFLRMKSVWAEVPVVVLTAHNDQFVGARAMMAGASGHLLKGRVDARRLMRSIRYAMQRPSFTGDISGRRISHNPLHVARNDSSERLLRAPARSRLRLCPANP